MAIRNRTAILGITLMLQVLGVLLGTNDATAQTLWIESGYKSARTCNGLMMYQTADTLYWFHSGFEAASNQISYTNDYFSRHDSLFQRPLSRYTLYTLGNPDSLPAAMKGPFYLGVVRADSLILDEKVTTTSKAKPNRVMKRASATQLSDAAKSKLDKLMKKNTYQVDVNQLLGIEGVKKTEIKYLDVSKMKLSPRDPHYSPNGIYFISDICFLLVPDAGRKFFQIIDVDKERILVESVCGKRNLVKLEKVVSRK